MPWTEDPQDAEARRIRETQSRVALLLHESVRRQMTLSGVDTLRLQSYESLALNALSNEGAMQTLHEGFAGKPKRSFLPTKSHQERTFETPTLPGVTVHVLGPSRDKDVIRDMDPPVGQSYLRLMESIGSSATDAPDAFSEGWWVRPEEYFYPNLLLSEDDRAKIRRLSAEMEFAVAASLDKAVNGTSLMLVLQVGSLYLLFPGDAQWGTWQAALNDPESRNLLRRINFYKVGHHGSHNATPIDFVERTVGKNFWAMASTTAVSQWPNIPRQPLLDALRLRTSKIARSDQANTAGPAFTVNKDIAIDAIIPL